MTQETALSILKTGVNVFLTGEPGSGKTHTINRYAEYLRERGIKPAVTASTGIAATHIGGMTIHSWSGIGIRKTLSQEELKELVGKKKIASRVSKTNVLIIDEISMLDGRALDSIEAGCEKGKNNRLPWGGMQIVFIGDFFQLPPIAREGEEPPIFAYLASAWARAKPVICYLSEQHRQEDKEFLSVLGSIRDGVINEKIHTVLSSRKTPPETKREHTRLYTHNADVDRINNEKLKSLRGKEDVFVMESRGPELFVQQLKRGCLSPETLCLKVGARVMFTKNNFKEGFANGTIGEIKHFTEERTPVVRAENGRMIRVDPMEWTLSDGSSTLATIIQLPLRLAWAITVHKSQGMTLDSAVVDLSAAFTYGQGYVAISRVRTLKGLFLLGYNTRSLEVDPRIIEIENKFQEQSRADEKQFLNTSLNERLAKEQSFIAKCGGKLKKSKDGVNKDAGKEDRRTSTYDKTFALWREGKRVEEIARDRGLAQSTIFSHLEELFMRGKLSSDELRQLAPPRLLENLPKIDAAFQELGAERLSPVFEKLGGEYSYSDLRLARIIIPKK